MHAHNSKLKKINRASKLKSDYTVLFVLIKVSKQASHHYVLMIFFERKCFLVYYDLLMMFAKIAYGFTECCFACLSSVKCILVFML